MKKLAERSPWETSQLHFNRLRVVWLVFWTTRRKTTAAPSFIAFSERPDLCDSFTAQQKRQACSRSLMRAGAEENDFAIVGNHFMRLFEFRGVHVQRAGNCFRLRFEIQRLAQIQDDDVLAGIDFFFELFRRNAGDLQPAQKPLTII